MDNKEIPLFHSKHSSFISLDIFLVFYKQEEKSEIGGFSDVLKRARHFSEGERGGR